MILSPTDLTYFIEITQTKNLSRAAERIGISQPSLSLAVQRIENSLGAPVLIRSKKGVALTPAGKNLQKYAKKLLDYWEQVKRKTRASHRELSGIITLGVHPSVGMYTLDKFIPKVLAQNPNININLHHDLSRKITEKVISFEIDLGLVINPVKHPDLVIKDLITDTVTLWRSNHKSELLDINSKKAVLICDPDLLQTQDLLKKLKKKGFHFSRIITSNNLENITNLTMAGAGIGIIPGFIVKRLAHKKIATIPEAPKFKDTLSIIYRLENRPIRLFQYLVTQIEGALKNNL